MKNLIQNTIDLLLDAYNKGELEHRSCTACAVGNICGGNDNWMYTVGTVEQGGSRAYLTTNSTSTIEKSLDLVKSTGFSVEELQRIESAFELSIVGKKEGRSHYLFNEPKKGQFIGLCAVLDVLQEIEKERNESSVDFQQEKNKLEKIYQEVC